ncbi:MAG: VPLPA-CTERM sorting domain-containing protein, partial [Boseongicola sp.]|nr:VPLPA-CTERM sorting domain-containing protein [Boseongicola sp.]
GNLSNNFGFGDFSSYDVVAFVFKQTNALAIFGYEGGEAPGTYSLASLFKNDAEINDLSHISVYGYNCEGDGCDDPGTVIPLPAAGWLLLGGLGGLAALRRRKEV